MNSKLIDVDITKEDCTNDTVAPARDINKSVIRNFSINISLKNKNCSLYGLCNNVEESKVIDSTFDVVSEASRGQGIADSLSDSSSIQNCHTTGRLTVRKRNCGGIVGYLNKGCTIINSTSDIEIIRSEKAELQDTGGICGRTYRDSKVKNCQFNGVIKYEGKLEDRLGPCGGIVGQMYDGKVVGCENKGYIDVDIDCVGGIAERMQGFIEKCANYGDIKGIKNVGGLVGMVGTNPESDKGGNVSDLSVIEKSKNHGSVQGESFVGGLFGFMQNAEVRQCYTFADVEGKENIDLSVGGFVEDYPDCVIESVLVKQIAESTSGLNIGKLTDKDVEELSVLVGL